MLSRIFKIVIDIVIVLCIASVIALVVPPLVGVSTVISRPDMDSNYSEGSVAYGTRTPVASLNVDDEIIYSGETYAYIYSVDSVDTALAEVNVTDKTTNESGVLQISKNAVKKAVVIPFIGYIMIAMETNTGKAMLISAAALLVMLFIVAELLNLERKKAKKAAREKGWDDENAEDEYFAALTESLEKPMDESKFTTSRLVTPPAENTEPSVSSETKVITKPLKDTRAIDEFILEPVNNSAPTKTVEKKSSEIAISDEDDSHVDDMLRELRGESHAEQREGSVTDDTQDTAAKAIEAALSSMGGKKTSAAKPNKANDARIILTEDEPSVPDEETVPDEKEAAAADEKASSVPEKKEEKTESRFERAHRHKAESKQDKEAEQPAKTAAAEPAPDEYEEVPSAQPSAAEAEPEEDYRYIPPANSRAYNTENIAAAFTEIPDDDSPASHDLSESEIPGVSEALIAALNTTQVSRSERTFQPSKPVEPEPSEDDMSEIELAIPVKTAEEIIDAAYAQGYDPAVTTDEVTGVRIIDFSDCLR